MVAGAWRVRLQRARADARRSMGTVDRRPAVTQRRSQASGRQQLGQRCAQCTRRQTRHPADERPAYKRPRYRRRFPEGWTDRLEQLLALPGDMRRHALVMLGFQINWLFVIAPEWTTEHLLPVVG